MADRIGRALDPRTLWDDNRGFGGRQGLAVSGRDNLYQGFRKSKPLF